LIDAGRAHESLSRLPLSAFGPIKKEVRWYFLGIQYFCVHGTNPLLFVNRFLVILLMLLAVMNDIDDSAQSVYGLCPYKSMVNEA
jgi:hypothetical protein